MYLPYADRIPDAQYTDLLLHIRKNGILVPTRQGNPAFTIWGYQMRFPFTNGFPMITTRNVSGKSKRTIFRQSIGELCAMINGAHTLQGFEDFGCYWWDDWATKAKSSKRGLPTGDIGPASYGPMFHDYPAGQGETYDQWQGLVDQIKEFPYDRTHQITTWHPAWLARQGGRINRATIAPCHGDVHVRILNDRLHMVMKQRSCDLPVGGPSNLIQYGAATLMLAQLTGYPVAEFVHWFDDVHIYEEQMWAVDEMLSRESRRLPTVTLTEDGRGITDIHDFRNHHFEIEDYDPHPHISRIPVRP